MPTFTEPPNGGKGQIRPPLLRLVHPAPPPAKRRRRHEGRVFTTEEHARARAALNGARARWRTWKELGEAMGCSPDVLRKAARRGVVSTAIVLRLCFLLNVSPQVLLAPIASAP